MDFSIYCIFGQTYGGNQARFSKMVFGLYEGAKNEAFPLKNLACEIFIFIVSKITILPNFQKIIFIIFIDVWPLCYQ